jgi:hypothetical protein
MIYTYCNSNKKKHLELSCESNNLKKIHNYTLRNNEILIEIFTCSKCDGLWKKMTFNKLTKWLKVGDVTVKQEEYIPFDSVGFYPIEHFEIEEAYDYDNSIFCGNPKETKFYNRLTCSPKNLILIDKINEDEGSMKELPNGNFEIKIPVENADETKISFNDEPKKEEQTDKFLVIKAFSSAKKLYSLFDKLAQDDRENKF